MPPTLNLVFLTAFIAWAGGLILFGFATWQAQLLPRPAAALLGPAFLMTGLLFLAGLVGQQWAPAAVAWHRSRHLVTDVDYQVGLIPLFVLVPLYFPNG